MPALHPTLLLWRPSRPHRRARRRCLRCRHWFWRTPTYLDLRCRRWTPQRSRRPVPERARRGIWLVLAWSRLRPVLRFPSLSWPTDTSARADGKTLRCRHRRCMRRSGSHAVMRAPAARPLGRGIHRRRHCVDALLAATAAVGAAVETDRGSHSPSAQLHHRPRRARVGVACRCRAAAARAAAAVPSAVRRATRSTGATGSAPSSVLLCRGRCGGGCCGGGCCCCDGPRVHRGTVRAAQRARHCHHHHHLHHHHHRCCCRFSAAGWRYPSCGCRHHDGAGDAVVCAVPLAPA